jgi:hypothetical protein
VSGESPFAPFNLAPATAAGHTPTFTWRVPTGISPTEYRLYVRDSVGASRDYDRWIPAPSICTAGTCSFKPALSLSGTAQWFVQGRVGTTSLPASAKVSVPITLGLLDAPVGLGPTGNGSNAPRFNWLEVTGATEYRLNIHDSGGTRVVFDRWLPASVCQFGSCSYIQTKRLSGTVEWFVQPRNADGTGPRSDVASFEATEESEFTATSLAPAGVGSAQPTYTWSEPFGTTPSDYRLYIIDSVGTSRDYDRWHSTGSICSGGSCAITPAVTVQGTVRWFVQGREASGAPLPVSETVTFMVP